MRWELLGVGRLYSSQVTSKILLQVRSVLFLFFCRLSFEDDPYSIVSDGVIKDVGKSSVFCK